MITRFVKTGAAGFLMAARGVAWGPARPVRLCELSATAPWERRAGSVDWQGKCQVPPMRLLPQLQYEQDNLLEVISHYDRAMSASSKSGLARDVCRIVTLLAQVRIEVVMPRCIGRAPNDLIEQSRDTMDLAGILVLEILEADPSSFLHDALVEGMGAGLQRLFLVEAAQHGLWPEAKAGGLDTRSLDVAIGHRLKTLDRLSRTEGWRPLLPGSLEATRSIRSRQRLD